MILTKLALEKKRVTLVLLIGVLFAGIQSYATLPRAEDPGFTVRTALVTTIFPGASPQRVETLVTARLEEEIQQIPEVESIRSVSGTSRSLIFVDIADDVSVLQPVWDDLRRRVEDAQKDLPDEALPSTVNDRFGDVYGVLIAVVAEGYTPVERLGFAEDVKEALLKVDDAAKVQILGDQPRRVFLTYDNARLAEHGLSPLYLADVLQRQNIVSPGGVISVGRESLSVEPSGSFESIAELAATPVALPGGSILTIGDLAEVSEGTVDPPDPMFRFMGEDAHLVALSLRQGGDILRLGRDVRQVLGELRGRYPIGVELLEANFQPDDVEKKIDDFMANLYQAVAIVVVVMVLFLGVRTGLVVASLIPAAMVSTFLLMSAFGVGIDQMSLAALLIALGMLVDNAIVMSENTMVRMEEGATAAEAALGAAGELWAPLLVSSLTTAAAFLPFYLGEGGSSEYVAPIFEVVTMALLASWLLAMTMVPLFCALGLKRPEPKAESGGASRATRLYRSALVALLGRPWLTLAVATLALVGAVKAFAFVPSKFFPPSEKPALTLKIELAAGTRLASAAEVASGLDAWLRAQSEQEGAVVKDWSIMVGDGLPRFVLTFTPPTRDNHVISGLVTASSREAVDGLITQLQRHIESTYPEALATVAPLQLGPSVANPVAFRIYGDDIPTLFERAGELKAHMRETPGLRAIGDDWGWRTKKVSVVVDPTRARIAGVTHQDVATSLYTGLSGITATSFRDGDKAVPVVIRGSEDDRAHIDKLDVFSLSGGKPVPLAQVADLHLEHQSSVIRRFDRSRMLTVFADVDEGYNAAALSVQLTSWLKEQVKGWPAGYTFTENGEANASSEANAAVFSTLPIAVLVIVVLLVLQFDSIRRTTINLIVLPYAIIGVTFGLLVTQSYFGFMTLLGIISLFGVVINNANVLIDRIDTEIAGGLSPAEAIPAASMARLRPILLTTATTVTGLIPLWLGGGPMFEPMAIVLIFGLIFGTALTLGLVPVFYALFFRVRV